MESGVTKMFEAVLTAAEREGVINSLNGKGNTALKTAIERGNLPAVQALLRRGANPHIVSDYEETVLHVAIDDPSILKYLLDNTEVSSSFDITGRAPVHVAVCHNNCASVELLLEKFQNPLVRTKRTGEWDTPLHLAAKEASNEAAKAIIKMFGHDDEDDEAKSGNGNSPYEIVMKIVDDEIKSIYEVKNYDGNTPLHVAAKHNNRELAALLLRSGAKLSTRDKDGATALELISSNFYDSPGFFNHVFDGFFRNEIMIGGCQVYVSYEVLTHGRDRHRDMSQIEIVEELVKCEETKALIHPLIESLLYLQWTHFLPLFYAMIGVYSVFLISVNVFVISVFYYEDMDRIASNGSLLATSGNGGFHAGLYWLLVVLIYVTTSILVLQESFFMYQRGWHYFGSVESWAKIGGLLLCALGPLAARAQVSNSSMS